MASIASKIGLLIGIVSARALSEMDSPETEQVQSSHDGAIGALIYTADVIADMARLLALAQGDADKFEELEKKAARNARRISNLESRQIMTDFYWENEDEIILPMSTTVVLHEWTVPAGHTVDIEAKYDTDTGADNRVGWLWIAQDGEWHARSASESSDINDNTQPVIFYKAKVEKDTTFQLLGWAMKYDHVIIPKHLQFGYKTYGPGHYWQEDDEVSKLLI